MTPLLLATLLASAPPPPARSPVAVVNALYKEVIARHPLGLLTGDDKAAIWPLLSTRLTRALDSLQLCEADYYALNRKRYAPEEASQLKSSVPWLELGLFSGGNEEALPVQVDIERLAPGSGGVILVHVLFAYNDTFETYGRPPDDSNRFQWRGVVTVVDEGDRYAVDDFQAFDDDSGTLDQGLPQLFPECNGAHWVGTLD